MSNTPMRMVSIRKNVQFTVCMDSHWIYKTRFGWISVPAVFELHSGGSIIVIVAILFRIVEIIKVM